MTLTPSPDIANEFILEGGDQRGRLLAVALGARVMRQAQPKYFLTANQAKHWRLLYDAGFWPKRMYRRVVFSRDPKPLELNRALEVARGLNHQSDDPFALSNPDNAPHLDR
jgi:hypothetical protein